MGSSKRFKAAIIGGSGYGGAELIRRLLYHPEVELARVSSIDYVDEPLGHAHPNLVGRTELCFEDISPAEAAEGCDVAIFALPHRASAAKVAELIEADVKVIDMSGDFRLRSVQAYEAAYETRHPHPEHVGKFVYGLTELNREHIAASRLVASPGCFATAIELALLPLARAGWLRGVVHVTGMTGSSGSGKAPAAGTHHPVRATNLRTYKPLRHQHTPEVTETLRAAGARDLAIRFVPVSAPLTRGIFVACHLELDMDLDESSLADVFDTTYAGEPFVRRVATRLPEVSAVAGSNYAEVGFAVGPITCFAALDNLGKGGAGQAVQNMNVVLGLPETMSLEAPGVWP